MAALERFKEFVEDGNEDFVSYVQRFEHFLKASEASDDLKGSMFIMAIEKKTYQQNAGIARKARKTYKHQVL